MRAGVSVARCRACGMGRSALARETGLDGQSLAGQLALPPPSCRNGRHGNLGQLAAAKPTCGLSGRSHPASPAHKWPPHRALPGPCRAAAGPCARQHRRLRGWLWWLWRLRPLLWWRLQPILWPPPPLRRPPAAPAAAAAGTEAPAAAAAAAAMMLALVYGAGSASPAAWERIESSRRRAVTASASVCGCWRCVCDLVRASCAPRALHSDLCSCNLRLAAQRHHAPRPSAHPDNALLIVAPLCGLFCCVGWTPTLWHRACRPACRVLEAHEHGHGVGCRCGATRCR